MEKREPSYTVGGNANWYNLYGEQYGVFFKKTKNRTNMWSNNPSPGHIPKENHNLKRYMHPNVHCNTIYKAGHGSNLNVHQQINE